MQYFLKFNWLIVKLILMQTYLYTFVFILFFNFVWYKGSLIHFKIKKNIKESHMLMSVLSFEEKVELLWSIDRRSRRRCLRRAKTLM